MNDVWMRKTEAERYLELRENWTCTTLFYYKKMGKNYSRFIKKDGKKLFVNVTYLINRKKPDGCTYEEFEEFCRDIEAIKESGVTYSEISKRLGISLTLLLSYLKLALTVGEDIYKKRRTALDGLMRELKIEINNKE